MAKKYLNINTGKMTPCNASDRSRCYDHAHPERLTKAIQDSGGVIPEHIPNPYTEKRMKTPPYLLELAATENSRTFADENGNVYITQYDENGGVGSMPLPAGKLIYRKQIREGSAKAWDQVAKSWEEKAARRQAELNRINGMKEKNDTP